MAKPIHRPERDRMIFQVLHAIRGKTPKEATKGCYVSPSTLARWRKSIKDGGTRYPQHHTLAAVAKVAGMEFRLQPVADHRRGSDDTDQTSRLETTT